eukprot:TRINITY_DN25900_c0_g1_i1.p1 TRINITY_DN25900_c0_g1~~TRINITY_DN25900_c0_g1_i1.p1  ORF type:complete len:291 (+),score=30.02 TRINITY_DN25900_c0_g1_i1:88-960(+)
MDASGEFALSQEDFRKRAQVRITRILRQLGPVASSVTIGPFLVAASDVVQKSKVQSQVEHVIALTPVVVISKTTCPFCKKAKQALFDSGSAECTEIIEIDRLESAVGREIQQLMGTLTGATTVPRVFIGRKFVGGGTETVELAQSGQLEKLIAAAKAEKQKELRGEHKALLQKDESEWASQLDARAYRVLRERGTERPHTHAYNEFLPEKGHFACAACALPVYSASSKYASTCGWPVFKLCYFSENIGCHVGTRSDGSGALEIFCQRCNSHLGHVFFDAFSDANPNGERH